MEIVLILGIFVLGIIGAALAILYAKGELKDALIPGIITGLLVLVLGFFIEGLTVATTALIVAFVLGIVMQLVMPGEKVEKMIGGK